MHTPDHHPAIIREVGELYGDNLAFKDVKFSAKVRDIHKIERKLSISINVFGYENKKYPIYVSKKILWRQTCFIINRRKRQKALCPY